MDERTTEILNRFADSWIKTEKFFDYLIDNYPGFENWKPIQQFIARLKEHGEDKFFRLGTIFVHSLTFSRSVLDRLRLDQKYLMIEVINHNEFEIT